MADQPSVPLPGEVPFLPQTAAQAAERDAMAYGTRQVPTGEVPRFAPAATMSVGSPAADDALIDALEAAHRFISRTTAWKGQEDEREQVLGLTAAALEAVTASPAP